MIEVKVCASIICCMIIKITFIFVMIFIRLAILYGYYNINCN